MIYATDAHTPQDKELRPLRPEGELVKEIVEMQDGKLPSSGCL